MAIDIITDTCFRVKNWIKGVLDRSALQKWRKLIYRLTQPLPQFSIEPLRLKETDRCLILVPHADDESIALGGLLLTIPKAFDVVCLTDCSKGDPNTTPEEVMHVRRLEFGEAMTSLGVNSWFFNESIVDSELRNSFDDFEILLTELNPHDYDYIFLSHPFDLHPDHIALSKHFKTYCKKHPLPNELNVVLYEVWSPMTLPTCYVDITEVIEQKKALVNMYPSQTKFIDYASRIRGLNHYRGMVSHVEFAECFQCISLTEFLELPI